MRGITQIFHNDRSRTEKTSFAALSSSLTIHSSDSAVKRYPAPMACSCQRNCAWHRFWGTEKATAEKDAASTADTAGNHSGALHSCEGPVETRNKSHKLMQHLPNSTPLRALATVIKL